MTNELPIRIPPMNDAVLTHEQVAALFRDLEALVTILEITVKGRRGTMDSAPQSLAKARQLLMSREAFGVQVRYRHEDQDWCDTLIPVDGGIRLVRIGTGSA